ncbi:MAG: N-methyl-L-tryptophan oxidase [Planctomycetota bacterium]|nr:N-methyl-L-tryptophan oxidase [Planctomycetota bacterium]
MRNFDVIVIGLGGMGTAAAYELAARGLRVLGLEQFSSTRHQQGSSHGETRIIRKAYFEHPDYVPLLQRASERWHDLEQLSRQSLFTQCGLLSIGAAESELITGVQQSARLHNLPVEELTQAELRRRFPQFQTDDSQTAIFEPQAGFLRVEQCVEAHAAAATSHGAELRFDQRVVSWQADKTGVTVQTERERFSAARLIITAGPWATRLLRDAGIPLTVMRQVACWFDVPQADDYSAARFPCYLVSTDGQAECAAGEYYGFPVLDSLGAKVARHYGAAEQEFPEQIEREPSDADREPLAGFLQRYLPGISGPVQRTSVCIYTLTPDRHFVLDLHPAYDNVCIAAGFSGHGFKFASVVGEILADLAEQGSTQLPIEMFRAGRFANR